MLQALATMTLGRAVGIGAKVAGALAVLGFAISLAGTTWTAHEIDDGLARIPGPLKAVAQESLEYAILGCRDNPLFRLLHPRVFRIEEVRREPACDVLPDGSGYVVTIRAYGPFASPREKITVGCGRGSDCGVFPIDWQQER